MALLIIPLLEGLSEVILSFFKMIKGYCALKISRYNQQIQNPLASQKQIIGFAITEEEENQDDANI